MAERVSSVTGSPNLEALVAVDVVSMEPAPTTGLIRSPMDGVEPEQDVLSRSSTISISWSLSRKMTTPDLMARSSSNLKILEDVGLSHAALCHSQWDWHLQAAIIFL